jgi:hypothetical protein
MVILLAGCFGPQPVVRSCHGEGCTGAETARADGGTAAKTTARDGGSAPGEAAAPAAGPDPQEMPALPDAAAAPSPDLAAEPPPPPPPPDAGAARVPADALVRADAASAPDRGPPAERAPPPDAAPDRAAPDAAANATCAPGTCKRVFIASRTMAAAGFGGLAVADAVCQTLADARGLAGTFRAWLSDSRATVEARLAHATQPYRLLDGTLVATDWIDLTDGFLAHAIDIYDDGTAVPAGVIHEVWTGTVASGAGSPATCMDWSNRGDLPPHALIGLSSQVDLRWTSAYVQYCNRTDVRVYCFEQ